MKSNTVKNEPLIIGYKLKVPYPAQKVGDFVNIEKTHNVGIPQVGWIYRFAISRITVDERLIKDVNFFEPIYFDKKVNDAVLIIRNKVIRAGIITGIAGENVEIRFNNGKPKTAIVKYDKVSDITHYWHFNSMLQPCLIPVTSQKGFNEMNQRVKLGNFFETKEQCRIAINKIEVLLKEKKEKV